MKKIYLKESPGKGMGVFAGEDIKKDEEICTDYGAGYWEEMAERNPELKKITNDQ